MSKKLLFKGGHATGMIPYEIEDFSTLYMRDARVDEKTKAYIDSVIGNSVLNLCPYRNVLVTHKYDTVEGNVITLDDCQDDEVIQLSEIQGNTLVNCCKDGSKELTLNGDIDTSGYGNVTLTEGINGGKVDVMCEGNTMVNVCDQEEPVAITKSCEVTTGNHVALQGEYNGKCRPNLYGNTLVNLIDDFKQVVAIQDPYTANNKGFTFTKEHTGGITYFVYKLKYPLDTSKKYTIIYDIVENTLVNTNSTFGIYTDGVYGAFETNTTTQGSSDGKLGRIISAQTTKSTDENLDCLSIGIHQGDAGGKLVIDNLMLLEGDYTNKPIPEYFTGMQSSFEDKLITDEKDAHNGKYKVDYKVTGKNKWNGAGNTMDKYTLGLFQKSYQGRYIKVGKPNTNYVLSVTDPIIPSGHWVVINAINPTTGALSQAMNICKTGQNSNNDVRNIVVSSDSNGFVRLSIYTYGYTEEHWKVVQNLKFQIEEGTKATTYEPYKEYTKTLYLNSPLLEGDTIEQSGNDIVHVHRYGSTTNEHLIPKYIELDENNNYRSDTSCACLFNFKNSTYSKPRADTIVYCDKLPFQKMSWSNTNIDSAICTVNSSYDFSIRLPLSVTGITAQDSKDECIEKFKTWNDNNLINIVYELATPKKEVISTNDNLLLDSYVNGHLDVDSVVPIDKVVFGYQYFKLVYLYPSTQYIVQFESDNVGKLDRMALGVNGYITEQNITKGINKFNITTGDSIGYGYLDIYGIGFNMSKIVVTPKVDGDFGYFKGMKSVGQNDVDGHKIEILSRNKNLLDNLIPYPITVAENDSKHNDGALLGVVKVKPNTTYIMSVTRDKEAGRVVAKMSNRIILPTELPQGLFIQDDIYNFLKSNYANGRSFEKIIYNQDFIKFTTLSDCNYLYVNVDSKYNMDNDVTEVTISNVQIEEVKDTSTTPTTYIPHQENKKEILMNEPLRGLPNGVKDKIVLIDGKWYIERNVGLYSMTNITDINFETVDSSHPNPSVGFWTTRGMNDFYNLTKSKQNTNNNNVCNNLASAESYYDTWANTDSYGLVWSDWFTNNKIGFRDKRFPTVEYKQQALDFFKTVKFNFELKTPTYEPLEVESTPTTYNDTTHISNNSLIPCNMVIRNSGFNCILKPSTLYTVALDTNKSGTIGMNLGGAKGTTTNNVLKLTTPATLTDNTLILYGKGIKASGVRLLEGDKTNWIPGYFTGMESAFEQELVTDEKDKNYGKYKVTVKVVGKNLFGGYINDFNNYTIHGGVYKSLKLNLKKGVVYTLNPIEVPIKGNYFLLCDNPNPNIAEAIWNGICYDGEKQPKYTFIYSKDLYLCYFNANGTTIDNFNNCINKIKVQLEQGDTATEYELYKENNITFYLKEPLRGVGNSKDKVYVKEDKVVVERNCGSATFDGNTTIQAGYVSTGIHSRKSIFVVDKKAYTDGSIVTVPKLICDKLVTKNLNLWANIDDQGSISVGTGGDIGVRLPIIYGSTQEEVKSNLAISPIKVVYQLATPTYEEVECDLSKLALEGYDHGTLFYDTNIPVTTQFYEFNVNIKDMLIPNETYYVTFTADRIKDIIINLSGVQVNYKTSMGYNKVPIQLGDVVNTNFSMDSRGVELSDLMISTSTSLIYVKDMNDVCVYDEVNNKYSITITSTNGKESDKRVILLDYPLLRLNKDIYDRLYYSNKDSKYKIDKKIFKHKFTNNHEYNKYAAETNDTYYSSFISLNEAIKDYVVITNEKVKTVKVEDDKYYFKIKWSDLGVSDKTEANGNQGVKDFFNNNEVYLYYATDGFVEIVDGLTRQTLKVYQPETTMKFLGNTTTTVTILIPMKNV